MSLAENCNTSPLNVGRGEGMVLTVGTWRESASDRAQEDLDSLTEFALMRAADRLAEHEGFAPFAAVVLQTGEIADLATVPDVSSVDTSTLRDQLYRTLNDSRQDFRAAAVTIDVRLRQSDAIDVHVEHQEGIAILVRYPYSLGADVTIDAPSGFTDQAQIWEQ